VAPIGTKDAGRDPCQALDVRFVRDEGTRLGRTAAHHVVDLSRRCSWQPPTR
jgi:hypothetical protein